MRDLRINGEIFEEVKSAKNILESLSLKLNTKKTTLETTQDLNILGLNELKDELVRYEKSLTQETIELVAETLQVKCDQ